MNSTFSVPCIIFKFKFISSSHLQYIELHFLLNYYIPHVQLNKRLDYSEFIKLTIFKEKPQNITGSIFSYARYKATSLSVT